MLSELLERHVKLNDRAVVPLEGEHCEPDCDKNQEIEEPRVSVQVDPVLGQFPQGILTNQRPAGRGIRSRGLIWAVLDGLWCTHAASKIVESLLDSQL